MLRAVSVLSAPPRSGAFRFARRNHCPGSSSSLRRSEITM